MGVGARLRLDRLVRKPPSSPAPLDETLERRDRALASTAAPIADSAKGTTLNSGSRNEVGREESALEEGVGGPRGRTTGAAAVGGSDREIDPSAAAEDDDEAEEEKEELAEEDPCG